MKRKYEHRPGLFGLASIAAGCAAKKGEAIKKSTIADGDNQMQTEPRRKPVKPKVANQSNGQNFGEEEKHK
jgi:hypothetical protein